MEVEGIAPFHGVPMQCYGNSRLICVGTPTAASLRGAKETDRRRHMSCGAAEWCGPAATGTSAVPDLPLRRVKWYNGHQTSSPGPLKGHSDHSGDPLLSAAMHSVKGASISQLLLW